MKRTTLFLAAAAIAAAVSASSGQSPGVSQAQKINKEKIVMIDDQMAPPTESPQVAWTECVVVKYKCASVSTGKSQGISLDSDVGWTATPINFYALCIDQQSGQNASNANFSSLIARDHDTGQPYVNSGQSFGEKVSILRVPCQQWATVKHRAWC